MPVAQPQPAPAPVMSKSEKSFWAVWKNRHLLQEVFKHNRRDSLAIMAAMYGNLDAFKYGVLTGWKEDGSDEILFAAVCDGNMGVVEWIYKNYPETHTQITIEKAIEYAADYGHLEIIKFMMKNGGEVTEDTLCLAARGGHLDIVKFLDENDITSAYADKEAASAGHLEVVKYLQKHGDGYITVSHQDNLIQVPAALYGAVQGAKLEIIKFLYEKNNYTPMQTGFALEKAAKRGSLHVVQCLYPKCKDYRFNILILALLGHLDIIKFLHKKWGDLGKITRQEILRIRSIGGGGCNENIYSRTAEYLRQYMGYMGIRDYARMSPEELERALDPFGGKS